MTGTVLKVCLSKEKGTAKKSVKRAMAKAGFGFEGDAHAGDWHRQVSLLADEDAKKMRQAGADVGPGDFGENILTEGIELSTLPIAAQLRIGKVLLEVTQIGKECHAHCAIFKSVGSCIMPTNGIFCKVLEEGHIEPGMDIQTILAEPA